MRPIRLTMSAFGPFAHTESIDFDALGHNPLFLINGPTGAGKTTILDAICFAMYGKTTGNEREGAQMRCDLADGQFLTEVELIFSIGSKRYRIRRVPEQLRQKKNGEGETPQKPEAQLYVQNELGQEQLLVAAKVSDATAEIEQITGLNVEQFRQVMVLPQGQFRQLLMADSKDREKIFSQLFQTHIYRKLEESLKQRKKLLVSQLEALHYQRDGILLNAELKTEQDIVFEFEPLQQALTQAVSAKDLAAQISLNANNALEASKVIAKEFDALALLKRQQQDWLQQTERLTHKKIQLAAAERARQILPIYQRYQERLAELEQLEQTAQQLNNTLQQAEQDHRQNQQAHERIPRLDADYQQLQHHLKQRQSSLPQLQELDQLEQELAKAKGAAQQAEQQAQQNSTQLEELLLKIQQGMGQAELLQQQSAKQLDAQQTLNELQKQIQLHQELQLVQQEIGQAQIELSTAKAEGLALNETHQQKKSSHQQLQLRWHQGQAAILALQLTPNQACPVCGSQEHPRPAQSHDELPTENQLQEAQHLEQLAMEALTQARERYAGLQQSLHEHQKRSASIREKLGSKSTEALAGLLQQQEQEQKTIQAMLNAKKQWQALQIDLQQWQALLQQLRAQQERYNQEKLQQYGLLAGLEGRWQQSYQALVGLYPNRDMLPKVWQLEQELAELAQTAIAAQQQIAEIRQAYELSGKQVTGLRSELLARQASAQLARQACETAQQQFAQQVTAHQFESEAAFQAAICSEPTLAELKQAVADYQQQGQQLEARMAQLQEGLTGKTPPDLAQLQQRLQQAQLNHRQAEQTWQALHLRHSVLTQTKRQLAHIQVQCERLEQDYGQVATLSDVANGLTGNKISLQRFVLSVLLDDVLIVASQRLQLMSKGRYLLLRKEDRAKGNKASGLELEVEDAYTSKVRSVATLSGGESFMAALAMALGVSDVVQAYAGGIRLDTLFIDEGFGSLDQESLDLAVRTLMDLQSSGRMIGVISHVAEMKEQIKARIDIYKTSAGSSTQVVLP